MSTSSIPTTFRITTLGCKVNQADSESIASALIDHGLRPAMDDASADVVVVNTCTVTHFGDRSSRQLISQGRRASPHALVVATGCYAQVAQDKVAALPGVDLVVPNNDKETIADAILTHMQMDDNSKTEQLDEQSLYLRPGDLQPFPDNPDMFLGQLLGRTRSQIKVQDGCDNRCTYCIVPLARGGSRSRSISDIIAFAQRKESAGFQEIVLTGIHLGDYHPTPDEDLGSLLSALLRETNIPRIRVSSLEPEDFKLEWLDLWENPRLCRHFHLPLQSGSDSILRRMARHYLSARYREIARTAYAAIPELALTTDIIVGFPGETEDDIERTYEMAQELCFAKMHVFRYSPRTGTAAARMGQQISSQVKQTRSERLLALNDDLSQKFRRQFVGHSVPVLWEKPQSSFWEGLTDTYLRVYLPITRLSGDHHLQHTITHVQVTGLWQDGVEGFLILK
jgi:threonylcarbamoyladenosine tRNA methylthiotransferase MtaB